MKEITLPAPKKIMISPSETTFENAWQYRRTCPLKISNSPFRINGFVHKKTSPLKKFHYAFSPSMLINNLYWECPVTYSLIIRNNLYQITFCLHKMVLPAPKKLIMTFPFQTMNSYVQECPIIQLDIFRQRMKHSTSNYCYFAQNNVARLKNPSWPLPLQKMNNRILVAR